MRLVQVAQHADDLERAAAFYSTLLRFNLAKFPALEGDLAQSWTVAPDLMTYTFKLHPNVKFADGSTQTITAVVKAFTGGEEEYAPEMDGMDESGDDSSQG